MMRLTRTTLISAVVFVVALLPRLFPAQPAGVLPEQLGNAEFWNLSASLSEPDGYFHSDNFVSNERSFQHVLADLRTNVQRGSAYIGVGPEQNFTYLLAVKPQIAFVVDIRRQNMIEHLMYKALFELSADRADFLSRLFSRARPSNLDANCSVDVLFDAFRNVPVDVELSRANFKAIKTRLITDHGFPLNEEDTDDLERVFFAFSTGAGNLTYDGPVRSAGVLTSTGIMPTFEELMRETDKEGNHQSFLATEENFRAIQTLQKKNLVVPVVGNFAGSHALRAVGQYLREHDATVAAFYTSNVEQYLFMQNMWQDFYANVNALPINEKSVFIRGLIRSSFGQLSSSPALPPSSHYETGLFPITELVASFKNGLVHNYYDILGDRR
jgi:hypothetical protein